VNLLYCRLAACPSVVASRHRQCAACSTDQGKVYPLAERAVMRQPGSVGSHTAESSPVAVLVLQVLHTTAAAATAGLQRTGSSLAGRPPPPADPREAVNFGRYTSSQVARDRGHLALAAMLLPGVPLTFVLNPEDLQVGLLPQVLVLLAWCCWSSARCSMLVAASQLA
jgi:hypothetical protein